MKRSTAILASGAMNALLSLQLLLILAAVVAVLVKERPDPRQRSFETAMASQDVVWR